MIYNITSYIPPTKVINKDRNFISNSSDIEKLIAQSTAEIMRINHINQIKIEWEVINQLKINGSCFSPKYHFSQKLKEFYLSIVSWFVVILLKGVKDSEYEKSYELIEYKLLYLVVTYVVNVY